MMPSTSFYSRAKEEKEKNKNKLGLLIVIERKNMQNQSITTTVQYDLRKMN